LTEVARVENISVSQQIVKTSNLCIVSASMIVQIRPGDMVTFDII